MAESIKKSLVAKFVNFDELYEQKILENEIVVKSLKSEIDAKCLELHEAIDPSQVPGLANSGVQLAETRSTLVNLYHLQPLLYDKILGHTPENIAWGHAHCNTFLSQRKSFSLEELKIHGTIISNKLYIDASGAFIRSEENRAWVLVTPIEPGPETFTAYLRRIGAIAALAEDDDSSED